MPPLGKNNVTRRAVDPQPRDSALASFAFLSRLTRCPTSGRFLSAPKPSTMELFRDDFAALVFSDASEKPPLVTDNLRDGSVRNSDLARCRISSDRRNGFGSVKSPASPASRSLRRATKTARFPGSHKVSQARLARTLNPHSLLVSSRLDFVGKPDLRMRPVVPPYRVRR